MPLPPPTIRRGLRGQFLLLLCCAPLCGTACHAQNQPLPSAADTTEVPPDSLQASPPTETMVDGGPIAMQEVRRRAVLRQDTLWAEALRIHYNALVLDGHLDTPTLMLDDHYRLGVRHRGPGTHVDLPRLFDGGLDAAFFSIFVASSFGEGEAATQRAHGMIAEVKRQLALHPDSIALATTSGEVQQLARSGRKAVLLGLEGGHALAGSADVLLALHAAGIRYVTLTHVNTNSWADASQSRPRWDGLNDLGRTLIGEMNRLGVLLDLSHASDATFFDALATTKAPVLLSHSSMRALAPNVRNIDDAMLRALADNGGVVMINFFDAMVNPHLDADLIAEAHRRLAANGQSLRMLWTTVYALKRERGLPGATLGDVLDHIDHAVRVAGIDHVGLGSDFDGVFDLPTGLEDVTRLPWITYGLLKRGYTEEAIYKILGGNALRVLEDAERIARQLTASPDG